MDNRNPHPNPTVRLKALLKESGLKSFRLDTTRRSITFSGRHREWMVVARLNENWLHLYTFVCDIPAETGLRARIFETAMQANATTTLAKFGAGAGLHLEIDYRAEHLDATVVSNLVSYLHYTAEEHYPRIFRIVAGDETLHQLESSMQPSEAA
jgi:hypothetical protein